MKKWWWLAIVLFFAVAGLIRFVALQNRGVGIKRPESKAERIVSLAPNLTEILFELGLGEKIVAVSDGSDYPPEASGKKRIGTFWQPNTEAIIASKPDLIITLWFEQQKAVADSLRRLGYQVLSLKIDKIRDLSEAIKEIGIAADCEQRADELIKNINNELNELQSRFSTMKKNKVLWVVQAEPLLVVGRNTFVNELIELAGGENAIGPTIQQYPQISSEELLACKADTIIQSSMSVDNIRKEQESAEAFWSKWPGLPAVKNNKIYVIDSDTVLRLGPRLPQGVEMIASYLHPATLTQKHGAVK